MTAPLIDTVDPRQRRLGRKYAPDPQDRAYELTDRRMRLMRAAPALRKLPWRLGPDRLDQGDTSECTVHAAEHLLEAAPRVHQVGWTRAHRTALYERAQDVDEWPGTDYDGTSFRAVCKVLQADGYIGSYLWVFDEDAAREYLTTRGPLAFGTEWFWNMFETDARGYVEPTGARAGGHEVMLRWWYPKNHYKYPDTIEALNSWGPEWGDGGLFRMKADAFRYLAFALNGDLCLPTELPRDVVLSA